MHKKMKLKKEVKLALKGMAAVVLLILIGSLIANFKAPKTSSTHLSSLVQPQNHIREHFIFERQPQPVITESEFTKNLDRILANSDPNGELRGLGDLNINDFGNLSLANPSEQIANFYIPAIDIKLPLYGIMSDGNSAAGVVSMYDYQRFSDKNYVLTGHSAPPSWLDSNVLLNKLQANVTNGMDIYISDEVNIYHYKVIDLRQTDEYAFHMIEKNRDDGQGNPILTIMTCYNGQAHLGRYFVTAKLEEKIPYSDKTLEKLLQK